MYFLSSIPERLRVMITAVKKSIEYELFDGQENYITLIVHVNHKDGHYVPLISLRPANGKEFFEFSKSTPAMVKAIAEFMLEAVDIVKE